MGFYSGLAATAAKLLASKGQLGILRQGGKPAYNVADSSVTAIASVDVTRKMALFDFDKGITQVRGNLIQKNDKQVIMEAGTVPTMEDSILDAVGVEYVIVSIGQVNPAGTPVIYDLHVRAG